MESLLGLPRLDLVKTHENPRSSGDHVLGIQDRYVVENYFAPYLVSFVSSVEDNEALLSEMSRQHCAYDSARPSASNHEIWPESGFLDCLYEDADAS